ncbi:MAG: AAA family ATPase, partial [Prochlorothrix sp.]
MLKTVEIQRFRCFETLKVHGFSRINLIGGKNNSGKTALLEALFFLTSGTALAALRIKAGRRESSELLKQIPDQAWHSFFYQQDASLPIYIDSYSEDQERRSIEITVENSIENLVSLDKPTASEDFKEFLEFVV